MTPDENAPLTVDLTIQEAIGIIGDLRHMIRLNRATSQEEEAAWARARPAAMRKLTRAMEGVSRKLAELPVADWPRLGNVWRAAGFYPATRVRRVRAFRTAFALPSLLK
jgi:hypothetical protein